jgi:hypothetical protein
VLTRGGLDRAKAGWTTVVMEATRPSAATMIEPGLVGPNWSLDCVDPLGRPTIVRERLKTITTHNCR